MSLDVHDVELIDGSNFLDTDRALIAMLRDVPNLIGGGAGQSVTTAVAMNLPTKYAVVVTPNQDATAWVTAKTAAGFNVVLAPRLAASTLAAGTVDIEILA